MSESRLTMEHEVAQRKGRRYALYRRHELRDRASAEKDRRRLRADMSGRTDGQRKNDREMETSRDHLSGPHFHNHGPGRIGDRSG